MASLTDFKLKQCGSLIDRSRPSFHPGITVKVKLKRETLDIVTFRSCCPGIDDASVSSPRQIPDVLSFAEEVDPFLAACFISSLRRSDNFFTQCLKTFSFICQQRKYPNRDLSARSSHITVLIPIMPQCKQLSLEADIRWSNRILSLWTNRLIIEDVFSWFSTLGGAYSSLGDYYNDCAIQAGFLSVKQLRLAWTLGDPFLQSRCLIYLSQSLMQRGYFKLARKLIRKQYQFAVSANPGDPRLVAMCEGVWTRLRYSQWKRKTDKGKDIQFKMVTLFHSSTMRGDVHSNGRISRVEVTN